MNDSLSRSQRYFDACNRNIAACERLLGKPLTASDRQSVEGMVHSIMKYAQKEWYRSRAKLR